MDARLQEHAGSHLSTVFTGEETEIRDLRLLGQAVALTFTLMSNQQPAQLIALFAGALRAGRTRLHITSKLL